MLFSQNVLTKERNLLKLSFNNSSINLLKAPTSYLNPFHNITKWILNLFLKSLLIEYKVEKNQNDILKLLKLNGGSKTMD